ncbi:MAG: hypothetical protein R3A45_08590 [Bdellovibrionota bacterium]
MQTSTIHIFVLLLFIQMHASAQDHQQMRFNCVQGNEMSCGPLSTSRFLQENHNGSESEAAFRMLYMMSSEQTLDREGNISTIGTITKSNLDVVQVFGVPFVPVSIAKASVGRQCDYFIANQTQLLFRRFDEVHPIGSELDLQVHDDKETLKLEVIEWLSKGYYVLMGFRGQVTQDDYPERYTFVSEGGTRMSAHQIGFLGYEEQGGRFVFWLSDPMQYQTVQWRADNFSQALMTNPYAVKGIVEYLDPM